MYTFSNELYDDSGKLLGKFSTHWAATAAMIRVSDPTFRSLSGDSEKDLVIETEIRQSLL